MGNFVRRDQMETNNLKLVHLANAQLDQVIKRVSRKVNFILDVSKLKGYMKNLLEEQSSVYERLEIDIKIDEFIVFIKAPQINDLLIDYLSLLLQQSITGITIKKNVLLKEEFKNQIVEIIENYFKKLSEGDTVIAIKKYLDTLLKICSSKISENIYSEFVEKKNGQIISKSQFAFRILEKDVYIKEAERIEMQMKKKFVPRNIEFEEIKRDYGKSLKQYSQNGYIYMLGDENKFNEFYIPPILVNVTRMQDMYIRRNLRFEKDKIDKIRERWKYIFNNNDIIYVVGGAGYGKSLFLKNIINNYSKLNIENSEDYLLIYCDLKTYFNGDVRKKTMIDFFQESMISIAGIEGISKELINYYLGIGRCIVLLDALDEVPKLEREGFHKKIVVFFSNCNPNNKVCITSRDRGFLPKQNIEVLEINPLMDKDIEDYIDKMIQLKKFKKGDKETFMKQAQILIEKGFLNNFLILSLLVNIYKSERELPENKIDLYKKCFEYIAKKREEEKSKTGYDWNRIYPLMKDSTFIRLSILAAPNNTDISRENVEELLLRLYKKKYVDEATAECAIKEFLDFCSNRTELFVPAAVDDKFKFFHRSFFEYFYSRYIHQQSEVEKMYELMSKFDVDSEVFELTVALVKEDDEEKYQDLINYILEKLEEEFNQPIPQGTAFGIMTLAMQVIDDAFYIGKYYEIIIHYHKIISSSQIDHMNQNQRLMSMWIEKEINRDKIKLNEFLDIYSVYCVQFLLGAMRNLNIDQMREARSVRWVRMREDVASDRDIYDPTGRIGNIPFYLLIFCKYGDLYELMEKYADQGFESNNIIKGNKNTLKTLKKGYKNYRRLTKEERKQILKIFTRK